MKEEVFNRRFDQLIKVTGQDFISFERGKWHDWEGYKLGVRGEAFKKLAFGSWNLQNPDYILECVKAAVMVSVPDHIKSQNLLDIKNYLFDVEPQLRRKKQKAAEAFFRLYRTNEDESSFNALNSLITIYDQISFVSYFFFLKDPEHYVTARKDGMSHRFALLDIRADIWQKCTWENYQKYLEYVKEVQTCITEKGIKCSLVDAQSFLWMLSRTEKPSVTPGFTPVISASLYTTPPISNEAHDETHIEPEKSNQFVDATGSELTDADLTEPDDVHTSEYMEGKQKKVYTTRYERNPKVRKMFLDRKERPYRCEVCGLSFEDVYGEIGRDFIEVHHIKPVSEGERMVNLADLVMLCSNCHSMIHRGKDHMLNVDELKHLINNMKLQT